MDYRVIRGIRNCQFKADDGTIVKGVVIYASVPISPKYGRGEMPRQQFFLSQKKLEALDFVPEVNMTIDINYNEYKKVKNIVLISDEDNDFIEVE